MSGTEIRDGDSTDSKGCGRAAAIFIMESLTCTRALREGSVMGRGALTEAVSVERGNDKDRVGSTCSVSVRDATTEWADTVVGAGALTGMGRAAMVEAVVAGAGNRDNSSSCSSSRGVAGMYTVGEALVGRATEEATGKGRLEKLAGKKPRG